MTLILAVDPGDSNVGVATFTDGICNFAVRMDVNPFVSYLEDNIDFFARVVVEDYRLYPWLAAQQGYSSLKTPQLIGVIKYICTRHAVPVVMQNATIKKPTFARMRANNVPLLGKNQHARDAEAHGYHHLHMGKS